MCSDKKKQNDETLNEGGLELEVTDFGPIISAKLDLRPLTVFVGPSNTGKSYLAILIYALHRFFGSRENLGYRPFRRSSNFGESVLDSLSKKSIAALVEAGRDITFEEGSHNETDFTLNAETAEALRIAFVANGGAIAREIIKSFGMSDTSSLTRKGTATAAHVLVRRKIPSQTEHIDHTLTLNSAVEYQTTIPTDINIPIYRSSLPFLEPWTQIHEELSDSIKGNKQLRLSYALEMLNLLGRQFLPHAVGEFGWPAYYLPADRTGVMHAHSVVVSALIGSAPTAGLRPASGTPMLSGVLADFLNQLIHIDRQPRSREAKSMSPLSTMIETNILDGSLRVDRSLLIDYPQFRFRPSGWKDDLALGNASSMVSELAPVVLYLRHVIEPSNVLIVEEPESHLHPAMQVELMRELAALVNAGVRVILTTHSEWLLDELANIVRRSTLPESARRKSQSDNVALKPKSVGAWLFEPKKRPRGSIVKEIHIDESGLYPTDFESVAIALHNDWADITRRIEARS